MSNSSLDLVAYVTQISNDKTNARNISIDPTGVILRNSVNNATSSFHKEVNTDMMITQTLEGYVLPLLPTVPLHIHNIHLKCEIIDGSTEYYQALALPKYKKNIGKYQILDIDNIPVTLLCSILMELSISTQRIVRIHLGFRQRKTGYTLLLLSEK